jgi:galactonate dehydratase
MKITKVTPLVLGTEWRNITFLKVETDEGLVGYGEARAVNRTDAVNGYLSEVTGRYVLGSDPFEVERLVHRLFREDYARAGETTMTGIALLEMACWDIIGKAVNEPIYRLLGGAVRDKVKAYANGWYTVERTPAEFHAAAQQVIARGYRALKFDPFGAGLYELDYAGKQQAIALVEAVRDAVGPEVEILVEMHGRFNPATAIEMMNALAPFRPAWYEEPIPPENLAALKKVATATAPLGVPLATGERLHTLHEYRELLELQAADILQPDITHFGGLLNTKKLAAWADAYYLLIAPHNVGGPVSTAAALHLAACTPNFKILEHFNDFAEPYVRDAAEGLPPVVDGYFSLPTGPGLGLTVNEEVIHEHPRQHIHFNLFTADWHKRKAIHPSASQPPGGSEPPGGFEPGGSESI